MQKRCRRHDTAPIRSPNESCRDLKVRTPTRIHVIFGNEPNITGIHELARTDVLDADQPGDELVQLACRRAGYYRRVFLTQVLMNRLDQGLLEEQDQFLIKATQSGFVGQISMASYWCVPCIKTPLRSLLH